MKTIKFFTAAVAALVLAASCNSNPGVELEAQLPDAAETDSVSYLVGLNFGYFIKSNNFGEDLNYAEVKKGLLDFLKAEGQPNDPAFNEQFEVSPDLMNQLFNEFISKRTAYTAELNLKLGEKFLSENKMKDGVNVTESGLQYIIIEEGSEVKAGAEDAVSVHYTGTLLDGTVFDESDKTAEPVEMQLNRVIKGWTEGLQLVGEGGKIKLFIPAELGYGERNMGTIGPNSTLIFDVEVVKVNKADAPAEE